MRIDEQGGAVPEAVGPEAIDVGAAFGCGADDVRLEGIDGGLDPREVGPRGLGVPIGLRETGHSGNKSTQTPGMQGEVCRTSVASGPKFQSIWPGVVKIALMSCSNVGLGDSLSMLWAAPKRASRPHPFSPLRGGQLGLELTRFRKVPRHWLKLVTSIDVPREY